MGRKYCGRYTEYIAPHLEKCKLNDYGIIYNPGSADMYFENVDVVWEQFYQALKHSMDMDKVEELQVAGGELLKWIEKKDNFAVALLLKIHPGFIDKYVKTLEVPKEVIELIDALEMKP